MSKSKFFLKIGGTRLNKFLTIIGLISFVYSYQANAKIWTVRPGSAYPSCSSISSLVGDNDTIYIRPGAYINDEQVTWSANNLYIAGKDGLPVLEAGDKIANDQSNGKGIFVVKGNNTVIERLEFRNAKVPDNNGAGIRQEGSNLTVRNCIFIGNEMGILQGGTIPNCTILIEYCLFYQNGSSNKPGYQHNIYINHIDTLIFRFNRTIDAIASGHELKSRASNNFIEYNKIANISTVDSRNIDLPNGGTAVIIGNVIEQGPISENSNIIGFGLEGLTNPGPHNLWIVNNTIVNSKETGSFVNVNDIDTLLMKNNICVGAKTGGFIVGECKVIDTSNNYINDDIFSAGFDFASEVMYRLNEDSPARNSGIDINMSVLGHSLKPTLEFVTENEYRTRYSDGSMDIGAFEYQPPADVEDIEQEDLTLSPNPASDYIEIQLPDNRRVNPTVESIKIYNALGECILVEQTPTSVQRIDVSSLPPGVYFVRLGEKVSKFIKI